MAHTEIRIIINRPLSEVFSTYTCSEAFQWSSLRNAHWTKGSPWKVGSRLRIDLEDDSVCVDQVLTDFHPNHFVGFISHFGGVTTQSRVYFRALSDEATEVYTELEFVGTFSRVLGLPLGAVIERGARRVYEDLKQECEQHAARQQRRSTRVPLQVKIEAQGIDEPVKTEGQTVVVSCHGALISTVHALQLRTRIEVHVIQTKKWALADVVHVEPRQPLLCGIGLLQPQNIWGVSLPPQDWPAAE